MRTMLLAAAVLALAAGEAGARRTTTCCVPGGPDAGGGTRPYCFVLRVRPGAIGARRLCRLLGGEPRRAAVR